MPVLESWQESWCADISGLGLHDYGVATEFSAHLATHIGVGAVTADKVDRRDLDALASVEILGGGQDSAFSLGEVNHAIRFSMRIRCAAAAFVDNIGSR